jgi:hypothetical protein
MSQSSVSAQSALRRLEQRQQLQAKRKKAPTGAMQQPAISNFLGGAVPEQKKQRIAEKEYDGIRSVRCVGCGTGRANKQCKEKLCKPCCIRNVQIEKCTTHGKKKTTSSSSN